MHIPAPIMLFGVGKLTMSGLAAADLLLTKGAVIVVCKSSKMEEEYERVKKFWKKIGGIEPRTF